MINPGQEFIQQVPPLENTFHSNPWLGAYLKHKIPKEYWNDIQIDLKELGAKCASPYLAIARRAEREKPVHVPYDGWGQRSDEIRMSAAWRELQDIAAREGLIHIGYKRRQREYSRLYQFSKLFLFHPSSAFFTCPLAMADGAAKVLELYGKETVHQDAFAHLTSNDPKDFWTSGQWMTEKTGGSDVSGTATLAIPKGSSFELHGVKWFSSATTSEMALALARIEGSQAGSRGLTLFLVPMNERPGVLNKIRVLRLKDKLGTWALPTAELELNGSVGYQVGERNQGVKTVTTMLNITRLYNSICSVGQMTRAFEQIRGYSNQRIVFNSPLSEQPLHTATFAEEQAKILAGFVLTMEMVHLLGKEECGVAQAEDQELLRFFTPITKLFTAKTAIQVASEVVEGFGGAGYVEDTGIPVHLRDAQVFSIWEGATNVLSLDLLRVIQKTQALETFQKNVAQRIKNVRKADLQGLVQVFSERMNQLNSTLECWLKAGQEVQVANARTMSFHLAWHYAFALVLTWADSESGSNIKTLQMWLSEMCGFLRIGPLKTPEQCQISKGAFRGQLEF